MGNYVETLNADVCVIGASSAGMPAAICAADEGAKVVLLEKMKRPGGTLGVCGGFFGVESPTQKRYGVHDTADDCFKELMPLLYWNCDARLVRNWLCESGETVKWFEGLGLTIDIVEPFQGRREYCRRTYHSVNVKPGEGQAGFHFLKTLVNAVNDRKDKIDLRCEAKATHILKDENGNICAVEAETPAGTILVNCKAAIIATGAISNNPELIKKYLGKDYSDIAIMSRVPHNTGDGIGLADEVNAHTGGISGLYIGPHNHGAGCSELTGMLIRRPQNMKLNISGERFMDEGVWMNSNFGWQISFAVDKQPLQKIWIVFGKNNLEEFEEKNEEIGFFEHHAAVRMTKGKKTERFKSDMVYDEYNFWDEKNDKPWMKNIWTETEKEIAAGRCKVCETPEEIAEFMGCEKPETVRASLERYNEFCRVGHDTDFLKDPKDLLPIEPPYYVYEGRSGVDTFIGGVYVNYNLNAVTEMGYPIDGLYAAGVCTSGWLNGGYAYYGTELSFSFFSGRASGKNAARFALGK